VLSQGISVLKEAQD